MHTVFFMLTFLHPELVVIDTQPSVLLKRVPCTVTKATVVGKRLASLVDDGSCRLFPILFWSSRWVSDTSGRFSMALMLGQGISGMELIKYVYVCEARPGFSSDSFQGDMEGARGCVGQLGKSPFMDKEAVVKRMKMTCLGS